MHCAAIRIFMLLEGIAVFARVQTLDLPADTVGAADGPGQTSHHNEFPKLRSVSLSNTTKRQQSPFLSELCICRWWATFADVLAGWDHYPLRESFGWGHHATHCKTPIDLNFLMDESNCLSRCPVYFSIPFPQNSVLSVRQCCCTPHLDLTQAIFNDIDLAMSGFISHRLGFSPCF